MATGAKRQRNPSNWCVKLLPYLILCIICVALIFFLTQSKCQTSNLVKYVSIANVSEEHQLMIFEKFVSLRAQTCQNYFDDGLAESGYFFIDPDLEGPLAPFLVFCNAETSKKSKIKIKSILILFCFSDATEISHDKEGKHDIHNCNGTACFQLSLNYSTGLDKIAALTKYSESCSQEIKVNFKTTRLKSLQSITARKG